MYYGKVSNYQKIVALTEMVTKPTQKMHKKSKIKKSKHSLGAPLVKAMFTCQPDIANVVQLPSNFHNKNIC